MKLFLQYLFGYTNANIQVGEQLTINQLLHVLLINSANEAANILAEHIAGSVGSFATMMNTNELIKKDTSDRADNYYYEYTTGAKTGYTNAAKNCIVATAKKDDIEYIVVILGAGTIENGLSARYLDCINLFDYAFENYTIKTIHEEGSILKKTKIPNASSATKNLNVAIEKEITVLLKKEADINSMTPTVDINSELKAPIAQNTVIGKITYEIDGNTYTSDLLAGTNVVESNAFNKILTICSIILVLFLLYKLLKTDKKLPLFYS